MYSVLFLVTAGNSLWLVPDWQEVATYMFRSRIIFVH